MKIYNQQQQFVARVLDAVHYFEENKLNPDEYYVVLEPQEKKRLIRHNIETQVADTQSLLGTTSDTTHVLLVAMVQLLRDLSDVSSLAEVRNIATRYQASFGPLTDAISSQQIRFPFQDKGMESVMTDITDRADKVSTILNVNRDTSQKDNGHQNTKPPKDIIDDIVMDAERRAKNKRKPS